MTATLVLAGGGTGGHVYPLIAVADALRELSPSLRLVFVGTERGLEARVVPERGYRLELMPVLPLRGAGVLGAVRGAWRAATLLPRSRRWLVAQDARAVFSIGGYAAGPVALAARTLGVPLALMEPNAVAGLANRLTAPLVQRAYTAFPEPERHFSPRVVLRSGVPLRPGFVPLPYRPPVGRPLELLVLGGSQGAAALNQAVPRAVAALGARVRVVHQCGAAHQAAVTETYRALGVAEARVVPFLDDMPAALGAADLVLGRAGASAVSELAAVGRAALLVPYPHAAGDHQRENARSLARAGAALVLDQREATPERLEAELRRLLDAPERLAELAAAARAFGRPEAARVIARDLLALAGLETPGSRRAETAGADAPSGDGASAASHGDGARHLDAQGGIA